jgi:hypothetical protein
MHRLMATTSPSKLALGGRVSKTVSLLTQVKIMKMPKETERFSGTISIGQDVSDDQVIAVILDCLGVPAEDEALYLPEEAAVLRGNRTADELYTIHETKRQFPEWMIVPESPEIAPRTGYAWMKRADRDKLFPTAVKLTLVSNSPRKSALMPSRFLSEADWSQIPEADRQAILEEAAKWVWKDQRWQRANKDKDTGRRESE